MKNSLSKFILALRLRTRGAQISLQVRPSGSKADVSLIAEVQEARERESQTADIKKRHEEINVSVPSIPLEIGHPVGWLAAPKTATPFCCGALLK